MFPVSYLVYSVNNHVCLLTNNKRVGSVNHEIYGPKQPSPLGCALRSFNKIFISLPTSTSRDYIYSTGVCFNLIGWVQGLLEFIRAGLGLIQGVVSQLSQSGTVLSIYNPLIMLSTMLATLTVLCTVYTCAVCAAICPILILTVLLQSKPR